MTLAELDARIAGLADTGADTPGAQTPDTASSPGPP